MAWQVPTEAQVLSELNGTEQALVNSIDAGDKLAIILPNVVNMVRGYIIAGGYPLGAAGSVPDGLVEDVIAIARWKFLLAIPEYQTVQSEARKKENDDAIAKLEKVASQEFAVEPPTAGVNPATGQWNSENRLVMRTHPVPDAAGQFQATPGGQNYANPNAPADT